MDAYLQTALRRAGFKLGAGLAVIGALVGVRLVTATPEGIEGELAELERFEAELAAQPQPDEEQASALEAEAAPGLLDGLMDDGAASADASGADPDRMVRCLLDAGLQYMGAADCGTRGGRIEELPPPEPEDEAAPAR